MTGMISVRQRVYGDECQNASGRERRCRYKKGCQMPANRSENLTHRLPKFGVVLPDADQHDAADDKHGERQSH